MTDDQVIDDIEVKEGWPKFSNRRNDVPTKGGITLETLRVWRRNPKANVAYLQNLTRQEARAIYQFMFLQPFDAVAEDRLRHFLVDLGVLRGPRAAAIMLQEIVGADQDGWIGKKTLEAMEQFTPDEIRVMMVGYRFAHIEAHLRKHPEDKEYRSGWRRRNASFL
jgi:lysozyme family protein